MNREELNKLTKEELIEEYIDLQDDYAWWERRWEAEHRIAFEEFKPRIDKAIEYINIETQGCDEEPIEGSWLYDLYAIRDILGDDKEC